MSETAIHTLKTEIFCRLYDKLQPSDSHLDNVYLEAQWGKHRLTLYALPEDNYTLTVEDYGYETKGVWHQLTLTTKQEQQLETRLEQELQRLYQQEQQEINYQKETQNHYQQLQETYNNINNNFYTGY